MRKVIQRTKTQWKILKRFFSIMKVRPYHIVIPIFLSFVASVFGGIGLALLLPLAKGVSANDYSFVYKIPVLKDVLGLFNRPDIEFITFNRSIFLFLSALVFLFTALKYIMEYIVKCLSAYWTGKFSARIKVFVFRRILSFGKLYFDKVSHGYVNTVILYTGKLLNLLDLFQLTIKETLDIIINFFIMICISWKLTIFTLALFPVLYIVLRKTLQLVHRLSKQYTSAEIDISKKVLNIINCIPLIKAYSKEESSYEVCSGGIEGLRRYQFRRRVFELLVEPVQNIIVLMGLLVIVAVVALVLAREQEAELAWFIVFFYIARQTLPKFGIYNNIRVQLLQLKPPIKEVVRVLEDKGKSFVKSGKKEFRGLRNRIEIEHLDFSYVDNILVLKDINLTIEKGKMTAIVGPTGSGKTTLVSLLVRLYECPPGRIRIDGIDIREFSIKSLLKHFSIVTQDIFLFNDTIRFNIEFGVDRKPSEDELWNVIEKARLYDFVKGLPDGLDTLIGERGIRLSGGEQQRVSIARALLRGAEILILDEATSSLDSHTERLIQEAIEEAVKGRTTIVIAHRLSTIKHADKVVVLEDGRIVEMGSLGELIEKRGRFFEYWQEQRFF